MTGQTRLLENRWDDAHAAGLDEPGKLLYRSNLLGADKRITNYGGGNTSAKVLEADPLTQRNSWTVYSRYYCGAADPTTPGISPYFADLHGLPPIQIYVGDLEVMRDDSVRFAEKARLAGVEVYLYGTAYSTFYVGTAVAP